jgi:hypothetical protein
MPFTNGTRVRIKAVRGGMKEFFGVTGTVIGLEKDGQIFMHRVELDESVTIPGLGDKVTDDLWSKDHLEELDE